MKCRYLWLKELVKTVRVERGRGINKDGTKGEKGKGK